MRFFFGVVLCCDLSPSSLDSFVGRYVRKDHCSKDKDATSKNVGFIITVGPAFDVDDEISVALNTKRVGTRVGVLNKQPCRYE